MTGPSTPAPEQPGTAPPAVPGTAAPALPAAAGLAAMPAAAAAGAAPPPAAPQGLLGRLRQHKVAEWALAYAAASYTLLHCVEMVSDAMDWPHFIQRVFILILALGFPLVITLAWYHGAKALRRVTGPELIIITILLAIAGSTLWALHGSGAERTASTLAGAGGTAATATTASAPRTAIAVMPFVNLTGDPGKDYLGDGMAEEVIDTLTKVPGLQVPARTSSFAYKGRNADIRQIARDLGVGAVLEGSVRSAGNRIRITAQLINAQTGLHLWSQAYDRNFTDLFRLQDDLATAIVTALRVNLNGPAPPAVGQPPPARDVQAYDLYLQGYSLTLLGSERNLRLALDLYQQALARDPTFARALAARSRARLTFLVRGYPLANAFEDAERDAQQALALDPALGAAHQALANVSALRANWLQAETSYRAALAAGPADPDIHSGYAMVVLAPTGRLQQAQSEGNRSYQLAPASPNHIGIASMLSFMRGQDADALKLADLAVALGAPASAGSLAQIYALAAARDTHYAEAAERTVAALSPVIRDAGGADVIRRLYAALGQPAERPAAGRALQDLVDRIGVGHLDAGNQREFILNFAMLGVLDPAYDLARRYLDEFLRSGTGGGASWGFLWLPEMRSFRADPRFQDFATRLHLIDYWRQFGPPDDCELKDGAVTCR